MQIDIANRDMWLDNAVKIRNLILAERAKEDAETLERWRNQKNIFGKLKNKPDSFPPSGLFGGWDYPTIRGGKTLGICEILIDMLRSNGTAAISLNHDEFSRLSHWLEKTQSKGDE